MRVGRRRMMCPTGKENREKWGDSWAEVREMHRIDYR